MSPDPDDFRVPRYIYGKMFMKIQAVFTKGANRQTNVGYYTGKTAV